MPSDLEWLELTGLNVDGRRADIAFRKCDTNCIVVEVTQKDTGLDIDIVT